MLEANLLVYAQDQAQLGLDSDYGNVVLLVRVPFADAPTGETLADLAGPVDVGLERDRVLRRADRLEHRGKNLVTILQIRYAIAGLDCRAEQLAHFAETSARGITR